MKLYERVGGRGGEEERIRVVLTYWFSGTAEDGDYGGGM